MVQDCLVYRKKEVTSLQKCYDHTADGKHWLSSDPHKERNFLPFKQK